MTIAVYGKGHAADQEHLIKIILAISQSGLGPFVYRIAHPDQL